MTDFNPQKEPDGSFSEATRQAIVNQLYLWADEYAIEKYPAEHRNHLGVSVIGDNCSRKLWYGFRWVKLKEFEGRMRRLFQRGKDEETKFTEMLMWMGFFVREVDPDTHKQYRFSKIGGHYGGSSDTIALLPWFRNEQDRILVEYKTHNDKWFEALKSKKLKLAQPKHYAQMCGYGAEFKTRYGLYCAVNKDTDEYYFEFIELDWNYAAQLERKASDIILAKLPPQRISENPAYWECKWCDFHGICHENKQVEINCRSCKYAMPIDEGKWSCTRFNLVIPEEMIAKGCLEHASINS